MKRIDVPVLIVGGGGSGLSVLTFLSSLGVDALLIERHGSTSILPKAHFFNQRSMEIFALHGMADAIYARSAPRENMGKLIWMTSLGGEGRFDRRTIIEADMMGCGEAQAPNDAKGFTHATNISQYSLELVLRQQLEKRNAHMLFRHSLEVFTQDAKGVTAQVKNLDTEEVLEVRAQYMIAADGGRTAGPMLGVQMLGPQGMGDFTSVVFKADLSEYIDNDRAVMRLFIHPERPPNGRFAGCLLTMGPENWNRHSEEFCAIWMTRADDPGATVTNENADSAVRDFFKIDVPIQVKFVSHWTLVAIVADRFKDGRVILIGDAAHRQTPGAGLGLNSGIQDAHNIAWKLAAILKNGADPALLDTYEVERRPTITRNVNWSLMSMSNTAVQMMAMGISPISPPVVNQMEFGRLFEDSPEGDTKRALLKEIMRTQRIEYNAHDMDMGFSYDAGALVPDGSPPPWRDPLGSDYRPTARPGRRLPHAWLDVDGQRRSTHELIPSGGYLILTGVSGGPWCVAAEKAAAELGLKMATYKIGSGGDAMELTAQWWGQSEIDDDGVVLVRPDGHVGFRSRTMVKDPYSALISALKKISFVDVK